MSRLNAQWNSKDVNVDNRFEEAMNLVVDEFLQCVRYTKNVWLPARNIVQSAVSKRLEVGSNIVFIYLHTFVYLSILDNSVYRSMHNVENIF